MRLQDLWIKHHHHHNNNNNNNNNNSNSNNNNNNNNNNEFISAYPFYTKLALLPKSQDNKHLLLSLQ